MFIYKMTLATAVALTLVYAFQGFYLGFVGPFSNVISPIIASGAVISSAFAARKYGPKPSKFLAIWICFTVGMALWFLGELSWAVYTFLLNVEIPYPSIADIFWLGGYVPLLIALFVYSRLFASVLSKQKKALIAALMIILGVLVSVALIVPIMGVEENLATLTIDLAYSLLDIVLLSTALVGLAIFQKGSLGKSWLWIILGILLNVAGDKIFSYTTAQGTYYNGHLSDLLFIYGYLLFMIAFYVHTKEL
ncbi:hypothetical protein MUP77_08990 [Candidatus Bathyarchaeota archaeon]|nr:hypothetical protein [Candidatus Bathyarchaeota archaeon]